MEIIAIVNQKGGVGKSTSTINLGVSLAQHKKRVLLVDLDPQGNLTMGLVTPTPDALENTIATQIGLLTAGEDAHLSDCIIHSEEGVDILPSNLDLSGTAIGLWNTVSRETVLKRLLKPIKSQYDYILIDCPPSLEILTVNALVAADSVIVPVTPDYYATKGLELLTRTIKSIRMTLNPKLKINGILLTMTSEQASFYREVKEHVQKNIGKMIPVYQASIPRAVKAAEAPQSQKSIFAHQKNGKVAKAYDEAVAELLSRERSKEKEMER